MSKKVLVITGDPLGRKLAGPAIRSWHISSELALENEVRLISMSAAEIQGDNFRTFFVQPGDNKSFVEHESWSDVIIFQGHAMSVFDSLRFSSKILIVDIYDPMHLEQLEQSRNLDFIDWSRHVDEATAVLNQQLCRGDFFVCASEIQKTFWLGQLAALGRVNAANYQNDPHLNNLISVVPFGLSRIPPVHEEPVLKGVLSGIKHGDKVVIWSGGLYNWFDPLTLVRAIGILSKTRPEVKLFFQGTKHPHPGVPEMHIVEQTRTLSEELGLLGKNVFLNDAWIDFGSRQNYLLEADIGVSTHHSHIETTFSFRTRILDYLWSGLPMVVTRGDVFADLIESRKLGIVVDEKNPQQLSDAIETLLFDVEMRKTAISAIREVREEYFWDVAVKPIVDFVRNAHRSADFIQVDFYMDKEKRSERKYSWLPFRVKKFVQKVQRDGWKAGLMKAFSSLAN